MSKTKFIIRDRYSGNRTLQEVFAEVAETAIAFKKVYACGNESDVKKIPVVKSNLCCSGKDS